MHLPLRTVTQATHHVWRCGPRAATSGSTNFRSFCCMCAPPVLTDALGICRPYFGFRVDALIKGILHSKHQRPELLQFCELVNIDVCVALARYAYKHKL